MNLSCTSSLIILQSEASIEHDAVCLFETVGVHPKYVTKIIKLFEMYTWIITPRFPLIRQIVCCRLQGNIHVKYCMDYVHVLAQHVLVKHKLQKLSRNAVFMAINNGHTSKLIRLYSSFDFLTVKYVLLYSKTVSSGDYCNPQIHIKN